MTEGTAQSNSERRRAPKRRAQQRSILEAAKKLLDKRDASELTLDAVAAEARMPLEAVEACFRAPNDLLLALSAQELAGVARTMYSDRKDEKQVMSSSSSALSLLRAAKQILGGETTAEAPAAGEDEPETVDVTDHHETEAAPAPRRPGLSLLRKTSPAEALAKSGALNSELGAILSDLTQDEMSIPDTATTLARLERRLYLLERTFADRQEEIAREKANASVMVDETINNLNQRLKSLERLQNETSADLHAGMTDLTGRMRLLEALPPAQSAIEQSKAAARAPSFELPAPGQPEVEALEPLVPESSITPASSEDKPEDLLATARRAAIEAAVQRAKADDAGRSRLLMPLTRAFSPKKGGGRKKLLLLGAAGMAILVAAAGAAFVTGVRNGALEQAMTPPRAVAQAGTVVAAPTPPEPEGVPLERLVELASTGDAKAELLLGLRYLEGQGVPRDEAEAFHWFMEASEGGEPLAQYWLANLYSREKGAMADPVAAARWYEAAAKQGNRMAMNNLAVAHADGIGTERSMAEAVRWFGEAAALGYVVSQFNLAVLYERGDGVPQNLSEAYKWYAVAAAQGDGEAKKRVDALAGELPAAELAKARAAAAGFKPQPMTRAANFAPNASELAGG